MPAITKKQTAEEAAEKIVDEAMAKGRQRYPNDIVMQLSFALGRLQSQIIRLLLEEI